MKEITSVEQLTDTLSGSNDQPVFIFKHSTACPISAGAHEKVKKYISGPDGEKPDFYMVKVIESRPISNAVEQQLAIRHQSPQLILVKDGQAVWSASHYGIHADAIADALKKVTA